MTTMTIGGRAAATQATFDVINPSTGEVHAQAPAAGQEQLDEAMSSAAEAYRTWRTDEKFRIEKMLELSQAMMAATPDFAADLAAENGKPWELGGTEGLVAATWLDYYGNLEIPREVLP